MIRRTLDVWSDCPNSAGTLVSSTIAADYTFTTFKARYNIIEPDHPHVRSTVAPYAHPADSPAGHSHGRYLQEVVPGSFSSDWTLVRKDIRELTPSSILVCRRRSKITRPSSSWNCWTTQKTLSDKAK